MKVPKPTTNNDDREIQDFVPTIFSGDPRWHKKGRHRYLSEFKGKKIGVVLATMAPGFDSYALNKNDYDSLLEARSSGKIDQAFIVAARQSGPNQFEYRSAVEAEKLQAVLTGMPRRGGRFGDFWTLYPSEFREEEWTM